MVHAMGSSDEQIQDPGSSALMNACPNCGEVINVSSCAPYSKVMCPTCNTAIRVRTEFHHFSLKKQIGEGGMSRVFLANDNTLNRPVALKILNQDFSKDATRIAQFEKEARITAAISHPNVVKVFSVGKDQEHFFIAMELVPNGSLDDLIAKKRGVAEDRVLEFGEQMAKGLRAAFEEGLIHRDMKPGNMLFAEDGTAKIVDFGLALVFEKDVDESDEIWATPYYVPPEKLHKEPEDFRSDIYSLGASLFHALAGKPPYAADTSSLEELKAIKEKPVKLKDFAPSVSDESCALIDRMMARQPEDRFASYNELIEAIVYTRNVRAGAVLIAPLAYRSEKSRPLLIGVIAAVAALVLLAVAVSLFGPNDDDVKNTKDPGETLIDLSEEGIGFDGTGRTTAQKFVEARRRMLNGRIPQAAKAFDEIVKDNSTQQPTLNWARFNLGLCALIENRTPLAYEMFTAIKEGGAFSSEESDAELATFFVKMAEGMTSPLPVLSELSESWNRKNYEALALLAYGLKNWQFGAFDEAGELFTAFEKATPEANDRWAEGYKALLGEFSEDIRVLKTLPDLARTASLDAYRSAFTQTEAVLKKLKKDGPAKENVAKRMERLKYSLRRIENKAQETEVMRMAALLDTEKLAFEELRLSLVDFRDGLKFPQAIEALKAVTFEHPEIKSAHEDELYVWSSAEEFLQVLIKDLNANSYQGTIKGVSGSWTNALITAASREKLDFKVAAGELSVPLDSVSNEGLIELAEAMPVQQEMTEYFKRRELLVLFAYLSGELQTALKVGEELMVDSREFRLRWKQITSRRQS